MRCETLRGKVAAKIRRSRRNVFLRSDFEDISTDYDQVGRALRQLVADGILLKLGYGLYSKARLNRYTKQPMLSAPGGFDQAAKEALNRLKVSWDLSKGTKQALRSNQIVVNTELAVNERFSRKIGVNKFKLRIVKDESSNS